MDLRFTCTQCGACCRNTKIPLTVAEAVEWLNDGNDVQVMCEGSREPGDEAVLDAKSAHMQRRSFSARSGTMSARIIVNLVANVVGDCANLQPDMRCGIYERRPLVCRIYPAEINPTVMVDPRAKNCPPEAWTESAALLMRDGSLADPEMQRDVQNWRETDVREVAVRQRLGAALGLDEAAVASEGFLIYSPTRAELSQGVVKALNSLHSPADTPWRLVTDRPDTLGLLTTAGADAGQPRVRAARPYQYIGFRHP